MERVISHITKVKKDKDIFDQAASSSRAIVGLKQKVKEVHSDMLKVSKIQNSSSKFLLFFVNDIIDFSQIKSKKFQKNISQFSIREAVDEIVEMQQF